MRETARNGFTLTELIFVIVIITLFIILLYPFVKDIRQKARVIACERNLQRIGLGVRVFAIEHDGNFPPNLGELVEGGYIESERYLDCPSSPHAGSSREPDYHYVTGYTATSSSDTELVFDKNENHKTGKHLLRVSGDVEWSGN